MIPEMPKRVVEEEPGLSVRAVERAAALVAALARQRGAAAIGELSTEMGLHPATTRRLLTTLVKLGWAEQIGRSSRYRVGPQLTGLGAMVQANSSLVHESQEILRRLADFSDYNSYVSVLVGGRVVYLVKAQTKSATTSNFELGMSHPFYAMADGKLLVSYLPEAERERLNADTEFRPFSSLTTLDPDLLRESFQTIRAQGYSVDVGGRFDFVTSVAVPVFDADMEAIASIVCLGRMNLDAESERRLSEQMKLLADELSQRLI